MSETAFIDSEAMAAEKVIENTFFYGYIKVMKKLGYTDWYIGMGCAVLQKVMDVLENELSIDTSEEATKRMVKE